jgi:hypothetical protein
LVATVQSVSSAAVDEMSGKSLLLSEKKLKKKQITFWSFMVD